jgi:hypothetical protein
MPIDLGTIDQLTPHQTKTAFQKLQRYANDLEAQLRDAQAKLDAIPSKLLTLNQIQAALSAGGSNALNLTGLVGEPAVAKTIAKAITSIPAPVNPSPPPPTPPPGTNPAPVPNPIPNPGTDDIPIGTITVVNSPALAPMTLTAKMTRMEITATDFNPDFSTEGTWPDVVIPGWINPDGSPGTLRFTLWIAVNIAGTWYASGVIQYWGGLVFNGGPPAYIGAPNPASGVADWFFPGGGWGVMTSYQPAVGEQVGFLVTAGNQRRNANDFVVSERSNVVKVPYPPGSGAVYTFA